MQLMSLCHYLYLPITCGVTAFGMAHWERATPAGIPSNDFPGSASQIQQIPLGAVSWLNKIRDAKDIATLAGLWESMRAALSMSPLLTTAAEPLLVRMVELDASAGWAWVLTLDRSISGQDSCWQNFLKAWGNFDNPAASAAVAAEPDEAKRKSYYTWIAQGMLERDPAAFLKSGVPEKWGITSELRNEALGALSETDLNAAAALAPEVLEQHNFRSDTLYNQLAASAVQQHGCQAAFQWAASLTKWPAATREKLQAKILESMALEDPVRAGAEISKILGSGVESSAEVIGSLLAKHDPTAVVTWLRGLGTNWQMDATLAQIGKTIGPNADAWVQAVAKGNNPSPETGDPSDPFTPRGNRELYRYHFREMLAGLSNQAAVRLAQDLSVQPASDSQAMLLSMSLGAVAQQDPAMALRLADKLPEALAAAARRQIAQGIGSPDQLSTNFTLDDQLNLLKQVETDSSATDGRGSDAADSLLSFIAERDPKAALAALKSSPHYSASAIEMIFATWTSQHPSAAAQATTELAEGQQSIATKAVMEEWLGLDSISASQWAEQLPSGAVKDEASAMIIKRLTETDSEPDLAFAWAASMSSEHLRIGSLKYVLRAWEDNDAAEKAIQESALDKATKQECLKIIAQSQK